MRGNPMDLDLHALETRSDLVAPRGAELMDEFYARLTFPPRQMVSGLTSFTRKSCVYDQKERKRFHGTKR
jgi:hypothetical protein